MKSMPLKSFHLPRERRVDHTVDAKPYLLIILLGFSGVALSFLRGVTVYGVALMLAMVFAAVVLPSRILIEFSEEYMVIYNRVDRSDCMMVYYEEIVEYRYLHQKKSDELLLQLEDGSSVRVPVFHKRRILSLMEHYAPGKLSRKGEKEG